MFQCVTATYLFTMLDGVATVAVLAMLYQDRLVCCFVKKECTPTVL